MAAATGLFAVLDALVFRPLPFSGSERVVHLDAPPAITRTLGRAELARLRQTMSELPHLEAKTETYSVSVFDEGSAAIVDWGLRPLLVTPGFFELFGRPAQGRAFTLADGQDRSQQRIIISDHVWRRWFGKRPDLLGKSVEIPGTPTGRGWVVVGIMRPGFDFPGGTNVWMPYDYRFANQAGVPTFARLAPGASVEMVRSLLPHVVVTPVRKYAEPKGAVSLAYLLIALLMLVSVAWVQAAGLIFAKTITQANEVGLRMALGATRLRVFTRIALEGGIIATGALIVAVIGAPVAANAIAAMLPSEMTVGQHIVVDARTLLFTVGLGVLALLAVSVIPAQLVRNASPSSLLRLSSQTGSPVRANRLRTALLFAQIACTGLLLYCSAITWQSARQLSKVDLGFTPHNLVGIRLPFTAAGRLANSTAETQPQKGSQIYADTLAAVSQLPSVESVASVGAWPLSVGYGDSIAVRPLRDYEKHFPATINYGTARYVEAVGVRVKSGTGFSSDHVIGTSVLVNETFERHLLQYGPAVGQEVATSPVRKYRVVGVTQDLVSARPNEPALAEMTILAPPGRVMVVRFREGRQTEGIHATLSVLKQIWGARAPRSVTHLSSEVGRATADYAARNSLLLAASGSAVPLALTGLLGAVAYSVRRRTREIAIRICLGAQTVDIRRVLYRELLFAVATAALGGLGGGLWLAFGMRKYLFGVSFVSIPSLIVVGLLIFLMTWVAIEITLRRVKMRNLVAGLASE